MSIDVVYDSDQICGMRVVLGCGLVMLLLLASVIVHS